MRAWLFSLWFAGERDAPGLVRPRTRLGEARCQVAFGVTGAGVEELFVGFVPVSDANYFYRIAAL